MNANRIPLPPCPADTGLPNGLVCVDAPADGLLAAPPPTSAPAPEPGCEVLKSLPAIEHCNDGRPDVVLPEPPVDDSFETLEPAAFTVHTSATPMLATAEGPSGSGLALPAVALFLVITGAAWVLIHRFTDSARKVPESVNADAQRRVIRFLEGDGEATRYLLAKHGVATAAKDGTMTARPSITDCGREHVDVLVVPSTLAAWQKQPWLNELGRLTQARVSAQVLDATGSTLRLTVAERKAA